MVLAQLRDFFLDMLDVLLPRRKDVALFDDLEPHVLGEHTHRVVYHHAIKVYAPLRFNSQLVRTCVHAAKYHGHVRASELLGVVLAPYVADIVAEKELFGTYEAPSIVPIPLHATRQQERGFNQAERIAQAVASNVSDSAYACRTDVLVRSTDTSAQARLSRSERLRNVEDAFVVAKSSKIKGTDIILVDDVVTTGATMAAARKALLDAGARSVLCVAAAH